jgi:hypothetical protein
MSINESVIEQLTAMEAACAAIRKTLGMAQLSAPQSSGEVKKGRKSKAEPSGEPKEKKPPSAWIVFSSKRVQPIVRAAEEGLDKNAKSGVGTVNQFAGSLWSQKKEWSDEEISAAWAEFEPPAVSKQAAAGKNKKSPSPSVGEGETEAPEADEEAEKPKTGKGSRKPQSAETKAAAALKRAATKAAKKGAAVPEAEAEEEEVAADEAPKPAAAAPKPPAAPKKAAFAPKPKKPVDLLLDPWMHEEVEYLKNERGDVVSAGGDWVGHWNGTELNTEAPEPADFETLTTRE